MLLYFVMSLVILILVALQYPLGDTMLQEPYAESIEVLMMQALAAFIDWCRMAYGQSPLPQTSAKLDWNLLERKLMSPNRYICTVFDEMRTCIETSNFSYLKGLIEEAQSLANRMESKIYDIHDFERLHEDIKDLEKKKKKLNADVNGDVDLDSP